MLTNMSKYSVFLFLIVSHVSWSINISNVLRIASSARSEMTSFRFFRHRNTSKSLVLLDTREGVLSWQSKEGGCIPHEVQLLFQSPDGIQYQHSAEIATGQLGYVVKSVHTKTTDDNVKNANNDGHRDDAVPLFWDKLYEQQKAYYTQLGAEIKKQNKK